MIQSIFDEPIVSFIITALANKYNFGYTKSEAKKEEKMQNIYKKEGSKLFKH